MHTDSVRKKIIVAEDNDWTRELIATRLELAGYHAIEARNGLEVLDRLSNSSPVAMVLDLVMPKLDGFGVMKLLQRRKRRLPIMVLSARNRADDIHKAIGLGADAYLTKPFDSKIFLERVERIINQPRASDSFALL